MATETPTAVADWAAEHIRWPEANVRVNILDQAAQHFAAAANWRWLVQGDTTKTLTNDTQEYTYTPAPTGFSRVLGVVLRIGEQMKTLRPKPIVPLNDYRAEPQFFSFSESGGNYVIRLWPKPSNYADADITPIVKLKQTQITSGNVGTAVLAHPDEHHHIYRMLVLHYLWRYTGKQDAGTARVNVDREGRRTIEYSGMLAEAEAAMEAIKLAEGMILDEHGGFLT